MEKTQVYLYVRNVPRKASVDGKMISHGSIVVYGTEYSYSRNGLTIRRTSESPNKILLGRTYVTESHLKNKIEMLTEDWTAEEYDAVNKNCSHFLKFLANVLGVDSSPIDKLGNAVYLYISDIRSYTSLSGKIVKHSSIVVYGTEYSYSDEGLTIQNAGESVDKVLLGLTDITEDGLKNRIKKLKEDWTKERYDVGTKNCHYFSKCLATYILGVDASPIDKIHKEAINFGTGVALVAKGIDIAMVLGFMFRVIGLRSSS